MSNYPLLDVFLSMVYFFCWILWIFLLFWIILDIFRSDDLSGWGKAGWLIFVIFLPRGLAGLRLGRWQTPVLRPHRLQADRAGDDAQYLTSEPARRGRGQPRHHW